METTQTKSGFCALVGRSNVGKSTILNALVGTKIAITSPKPQTTQFPIRGIVTRDEGQIVFVDGPGISTSRARSELTKRLNERARQAMAGVDVVLYIVDPSRAPGPEEHLTRNMVIKSSAKKILVINKIDLPSTPWKEEYLLDQADYDATVEISARTEKNLKELVAIIFELLPYGEPLYPRGQFTDVSHETWLSEIIREKAFLTLRQELPYNLLVRIEETEERPNGVYAILAIIEVSNERYKPMVIGAKGQTLRAIGQAARREFEGALRRKVFLHLEVRVNTHLYQHMQ